MTGLLFGLTQLALIAAQSAPLAHRGTDPAIERVRMVCDQFCDCWQTRYRIQPPLPAGREDLACPSPRPDRDRHAYYYNGHYRTGPATGIGFESKSPVREFGFPF
ncbi:hypothetical protein [Bradyrhizobium sp.]|uniref:hypothetical protein n=1 Tax=Bradyrhizobium sp. TaxID=376 RepID=UPI0039E44D7B